MADQFIDKPMPSSVAPEFIDTPEPQFVERGQTQSSPGFLGKVKDVGEGLVRYASSIPGVAARGGLFDEAAKNIAKKFVAGKEAKILRGLGVNIPETRTPEMEAKATSQPFSKYASGPQVGGNPESKLAKGVEKGLNIAETVGGLAAAVKGITRAATKKGLTKLVMPKVTAGVEEEAAKQGLKKINIFGKVIIKPSKQIEKMVEVGKKFLSPRKSVVTNINRAIKAEAKETDNLINIAKATPKPIPVKQVSAELNRIEPPLSIRSNTELLNKFNTIKKTFVDMYAKSAKKTTEGLLNTRKEFYKLIQKEFPNLWTSDAETPTRIVVRAIQDSSKNLLNKKVGGTAVKESLEKQSNIMSIIENLATKTEKTGTSAVGRWIARNKGKLGAAGATAGAIYGLKSLKDLISGQKE